MCTNKEANGKKMPPNQHLLRNKQWTKARITVSNVADAWHTVSEELWVRGRWTGRNTPCGCDNEIKSTSKLLHWELERKENESENTVRCYELCSEEDTCSVGALKGSIHHNKDWTELVTQHYTKDGVTGKDKKRTTVPETNSLRF